VNIDLDDLSKSCFTVEYAAQLRLVTLEYTLCEVHLLTWSCMLCQVDLSLCDMLHMKDTLLLI
jgi:hypothetical protein